MSNGANREKRKNKGGLSSPKGEKQLKGKMDQCTSTNQFIKRWPLGDTMPLKILYRKEWGSQVGVGPGLANLISQRKVSSGGPGKGEKDTAQDMFHCGIGDFGGRERRSGGNRKERAICFQSV